MKIIRVLTAIILLSSVCGQVYSDERSKKKQIVIKFNNTEYVHRWSKNDQHEFTPNGQSDLSKWNDMLTINYYRSVSSGDALALVANQVLGKYEQHGGKVLRTDSVPRTKDMPAEHLIAVVLGQSEFLEFAQARFKIIDGVGASIIYSHRVYGSKVGPEMSTWLRTNALGLEAELMELKNIPSFANLTSISSN